MGAVPDFIMNGQGHGKVANILIATGGDVGALRPWYDPMTNANYVELTNNVSGAKEVVRIGGEVNAIMNTPSTLRYEAWKQIDATLLRIAKERLRLYADIRGAGLKYAVGNGMATTVLQSEAQSDMTGATISMDGMRRSETDRPEYDLTNFPLPIIHKDVEFPLRQILASRQSGTALDTSSLEDAVRKVAEEVEKMAIGVSDFNSFSFGSGTMPGVTTFADRNTYVLADPSDPGYVPADTLADVLAMKAAAHADFQMGPYFCYCSPEWDKYMDDDYSATKGDITLRDRLAKVENVDRPQTLDFLTGTQLLLIQKASHTIRAVVGMEMTTVQWESHGGMGQHYKVMAILHTQLRSDYDNQCGIVHGNI